MKKINKKKDSKLQKYKSSIFAVDKIQYKFLYFINAIHLEIQESRSSEIVIVPQKKHA